MDDALDPAATRNPTRTAPSRSRIGRSRPRPRCGGKLLGLAAENTQARCRMVCLMALSNAYGWMLVNTGNKSEAMMGYSTLYGDTAGAFAPIGGLYKTDVFAVARWRNRQAEIAGEVPPIPEHET
ncbi:MAG: NAD(+) synthase [Eggerthella lenta]